MKDTTSNNISFAIGTGRCGTKFLYKVFDLEPKIASVHERNPLNETFHRYCKWYDIPVDSEGFLHTKEKEIQADLAKFDYSFESSAHLSLSVEELYQRFNAKFILLLRSPHEVVNSYLRKGWYEQTILRSDANLPPSYQESKLFHHFLGRIVPSGDKFEQWQKMTRVGKIAWFWKALNEKVLQQFEKIPSTHWRVDKLEELTYDRYLEIAHFLSINSQLQRQTYQQLADSRPNSFSNIRSISSWSETEIAEFEAEVAPLAQQLGYEYRVQNLLQQSTSKETPQQRQKQPLTITPTQFSPKEVTGIVRSVGERTEQACRYLLSQQIPEENIVTINEVPFSVAVAKTFKVGLERNLPWTLCLDADVLIKQGAVNELLSAAEQLEETSLGLQGLILCKFFGGLRGAGNRLYRTSLLPQALDCIPQQETIRPETDTILGMEAKGFSWQLVEVTVGLHDYEQYYKDIYRKCFTQAHKHHYLMKKLFEPLWSRQASVDSDYQVALWGLRAGQIFDGEVQINTEQFPDQINELLAIKGWQEKRDRLSLEELSQIDVKQMIDSFDPCEEYLQYFKPSLDRLLRKIPKQSKQSRGVKKAANFIGKGLQQLGRIIESYSE